MNVLAVGCHPDDLEIACFGTLARYAANGDRVVVCTVSNGNMGHVEIMPDELRKIRLEESREAAKVIGAEHVSLDVGDLQVEACGKSVRDKLIAVVRRTEPDIIITHYTDDYMRDHQQASGLAFDASFGSSIPHTVGDVKAYEKIAPLYYMDTLAGIGFIPTEYVDISDTVEIKLKALECHESQVKWMLDHDGIDFIDFVRTNSKYRGLQCGVPYAEGFRQFAGWPRFTTERVLP